MAKLYNPREIAVAAGEVLPLAENVCARLIGESLLESTAVRTGQKVISEELLQLRALVNGASKPKFAPSGPFSFNGDGLPADRNSSLFQRLIRDQLGLDGNKLDAGKAAILHPRFSRQELDFSLVKSRDLGTWGSSEQGFGIVEYQSLPSHRGYLKNADSVVRVTKNIDLGTAEGQAERASSGVFVRASGKIATNEHVARNASSLQVETLSGERFSAEVVAVDKASDLAILQLHSPPGKRFPVPEFSQGATPLFGKVAAVGHHGGLKDLIAAPGQWTGASAGQNKYMIDGAMPGASGSPIFDSEGRLLGLTAKIYPHTRKLATGPSIDTIETTLMRFGLFRS